MRLSEVNANQIAEIQAVHTARAQHLLEPMGFISGAEITVKSKSRGYVFVNVNDRQFVVGEDLAKCVIV